MYSRCLSCAVAIALSLAACSRENVELRPSPASAAVFDGAAAEGQLRPGGSTPEPQVKNPYEGNAQAISEGQRLFAWYNCSGCHANGGGGMGPPLIKDNWIYGSEPANLFDTIVKGRPNGMPSWGEKIPHYQIWQIVTWIRSMNRLEPTAATPARADTPEQNSGTILNSPQQVTK